MWQTRTSVVLCPVLNATILICRGSLSGSAVITSPKAAQEEMNDLSTAD